MNDLGSNLKTIFIGGIPLYYNIGYYVSEAGDLDWTEFWLSKPKTKMVKRWWFFGELEEVIDQKPDFKVNFDITSRLYTKEDVRKSVKRNLELYYRQNEIDKGEII